MTIDSDHADLSQSSSKKRLGCKRSHISDNSWLSTTVKEGKGSRVRIGLNGVVFVFHRPHPQKETVKGAVESARDFLGEAGIVLDEDD